MTRVRKSCKIDPEDYTAKREMKIERPRVRRRWKIVPSTRLEESRKVYRREEEKENLRHLVGEEERVLGVDLGEKRVGLAISDPTRTIAKPLETVDRRDIFRRLVVLLGRYKVGEIVVGLPLNMDGTKGERAEDAERFAADLEEEFGLAVALYDERLTSVAAEKGMRERGESPSRDKERVDQISAALILEGYIRSRA